MKKLVVVFLALTIVLSLSSTAFASEDKEKPEVSFSSVIVEREDVSERDALSDNTFSAAKNAQSKSVQNKNAELKATPGEPYWRVWGVRKLNKNTGLYYPVGYSGQMQGGTFLRTYHYTRTFLGPTWSPRGDSGRIWGEFCVMAKGKDCMEEVWAIYTHRVFYGTTN